MLPDWEWPWEFGSDLGNLQYGRNYSESTKKIISIENACYGWNNLCGYSTLMERSFQFRCMCFSARILLHNPYSKTLFNVVKKYKLMFFLVSEVQNRNMCRAAQIYFDLSSWTYSKIYFFVRHNVLLKINSVYVS